MLLPAVPALAQPQTQPQNGALTVQPDSQNDPAGSHSNQTTGGKTDNPAHIYKKGEHISRTYGAFDDVMDWAHFNLMRPPAGSHWVKYADNYLLVDDKSGLISDIVKAS
jgi:Ni/Co efflux regulator RcnB